MQSVGSIRLAIKSGERAAELGAAVGRAHWSKGIATAVARLVVHFAFDKLGLLELRAELLQSSLSSRHVLEKLGFHVESEIPDFDESKTGSQDGYLYALRSHSAVEST